MMCTVVAVLEWCTPQRKTGGGGGGPGDSEWAVNRGEGESRHDRIGRPRKNESPELWAQGSDLAGVACRGSPVPECGEQ